MVETVYLFNELKEKTVYLGKQKDPYIPATFPYV